MAQSGLHFEWRSLPENDFSSGTELAVVTFSGRCEVIPFAINSQIHQRPRLDTSHRRYPAIH
jgi:hypothetical protein